MSDLVNQYVQDTQDIKRRTGLTDGEIHAIRMIARGEASGPQQKEGLEAVIYVIAGIGSVTYPSHKTTGIQLAHADGRTSVARDILDLLNREQAKQ